jgi:hypothetical protein
VEGNELHKKNAMGLCKIPEMKPETESENETRQASGSMRQPAIARAENQRRFVII